MSEDRPIKESVRKYPLLGISIVAIIALLAVLGWLFVCRASFTIGHTRFRFLSQSVSKASSSANFNPKAVFINIGWKDPTGEITRGRAYGLRFASRVFELDTYYAPRGFRGSLANF